MYKNKQRNKIYIYIYSPFVYFVFPCHPFYLPCIHSMFPLRSHVLISFTLFISFNVPCVLMSCFFYCLFYLFPSLIVYISDPTSSFFSCSFKVSFAFTCIDFSRTVYFIQCSFVFSCFVSFISACRL